MSCLLAQFGEDVLERHSGINVKCDGTHIDIYVY